MELKQPTSAHPNLSDAINANIAEGEILGGVWAIQPSGDAVKDEPVLPVGGIVEVQTEDALYTIMKTGDETFTIQGHQKFCPRMSQCRIHGSTWGGSMIKMGWIGRGMHLKFSTADSGTITTSRVNEITELPR